MIKSLFCFKKLLLYKLNYMFRNMTSNITIYNMFKELFNPPIG